MPAGTQASGQEGSHSAQGRGEELDFGVESRGQERGRGVGQGWGRRQKGAFLAKASSDFTEGLLLTDRPFWCSSHMPGPLGSQPGPKGTQPVWELEVQGDLCLSEPAMTVLL